MLEKQKEGVLRAAQILQLDADNRVCLNAWRPFMSKLTDLSHSDVARYGFGLLFALAALGVVFFSDNRHAENGAYATLGSLGTAFITRRVP